jgi:hypothetical protein
MFLQRWEYLRNKFQTFFLFKNFITMSKGDLIFSWEICIQYRKTGCRNDKRNTDHCKNGNHTSILDYRESRTYSEGPTVKFFSSSLLTSLVINSQLSLCPLWWLYLFTLKSHRSRFRFDGVVIAAQCTAQ